MLNLHRASISKFLAPLVGRLADAGVSPDVVTLVGTIGVAGGALGFYTRGSFVIGTLVITAFVFSDLLDGQIARARGIASTWGAFLDSALDRVGDGAVFGSFVIWYAGRGHSLPLTCAAVGCLIGGSVTSYIRAKAESLRLTANVGFAERAERLIIVLIAAFLCGVGVPYVLPGALWFLAGATTITVAQRVASVRQQTNTLTAAGHGRLPNTEPDPVTDPVTATDTPTGSNTGTGTSTGSSTGSGTGTGSGTDAAPVATTPAPHSAPDAPTPSTPHPARR